MKSFSKSQAPQLSARLLRITLVWVIILIATVVYTLFLSWRMESATNSVRQVMALQTEIYEMGYVVGLKDDAKFDMAGSVWRIDRMIASSVLGEDAYYRVMARDERINEAFAQINNLWRQSLKPKLLRWNAQKGTIAEREAFLTEIGEFNTYIREWITYIEADANRNIIVLRYTQVALGVASVLSIIIAMWFLAVSVLRPLNQLRTGIEHLRSSDWKAQVHAEGSLEFSQISAGFNDLASHLDDVYTNLENKVEEKTRSLAENNKYLTSLYGLTAFLGEQHSLSELCESFLVRVLAMTQGVAGDIRFVEGRHGKTSLVCVNGLADAVTPIQASASDAFFAQMIANPYPRTIRIADYPLAVKSLKGELHFVKFYHIRHKQTDIGLVTLFFTEAPENNPDIDTHLETLGRHLGSAIENARLMALDQQMAVAQERNIMAQNLHDSIAQTLSFVNLQAQMLESALKQKNEQQIDDGIHQIKAGIQECYDDVRELLLNFRTRISGGDFEDVVHTVLERFERQNHIRAHLAMSGAGAALTHAQKLQVIFILQEALSNVRKHARANAVLVRIRNAEDFEMSIMDDGIGIDPQILEARKQSHVGLSIMKERAQKVEGSIAIESELGQGTVVKFFLSKEARTSL